MNDWSQHSLRQLIGAPISGSRPIGGVDAESEGIPSLGGENIREDGGVTFASLKRVPEGFYRLMPKGRLQPFDVLINKDGAQTGKVGLYQGDFSEACVNEHLFILRSAKINQRLLYYFMLLPETQAAIARRITGSAQPGLNSSFVDAVKITIPTEGCEQRRMAEILSTVDDAIEQTEALIAKTQQIKSGMVHDLFTRGVTPDGQLRPPRDEAPHLYKESLVGGIPNGWGISNAETEFDVASGITLGPHRRPKQNPHPYLRVANVHRERLDTDDVLYIEVLPQELVGKSLVTGDLLVVEGHADPHEIGRCAMVTSEVEGFTFQNHLFRLRRRRLEALFGLHWMNGNVVRAYWRRVCSTSSGLNTINRTKLGNVPILVPANDEQERIGTTLNQVSQTLNTAQENLAKLDVLRRGLMQDLLTGRVRVPISKVGEVSVDV